ncbi:MAG: hypothetical protein PHV34_01205 [Verrucomicrobiae bacterium]|nr:hypothetical protein [Verrucomicrobiae bacterium]
MTRSDWKAYVQQWKTTGAELNRIRQKEVCGWKYDWRVVDALLDMGARFKDVRPTSGLVELQRWFMKLAEQQGGLPARSSVKESSASYCAEDRVVKPMRRHDKAGHRKRP